MSFSQYERYLQQIDPNINQPKFLKEPPPDSVDPSAQSIFSVSTRKSLFTIKRSIKTKVRWRRKSIAQIEVPMFVEAPLLSFVVYA